MPVPERRTGSICVPRQYSVQNEYPPFLRFRREFQVVGTSTVRRKVVSRARFGSPLQKEGAHKAPFAFFFHRAHNPPKADGRFKSCPRYSMGLPHDL